MIELTLVRHATLQVKIAGARFLVDPMLDPPGAQPPVPDTRVPRRNPLVPLPQPAESIVEETDVVCLTHLHVDHFDTTASELILERQLPIICQPADESHLRELGFEHVEPAAEKSTWRDVRITRTAARHGTGAIAELLAPASGFVLQSATDSLYIAGDTVWYEEVEGTLLRHSPATVVVNAGEARLREGDPITMDARDVIATSKRAAPSRVVAVHMEALNHCALSREALAAETSRAGVKIEIPADGQRLEL